MRCSLIALFLLGLASPAFAQRFLFGLKAGVPMTEYFKARSNEAPERIGSITYSAATRRYTIGASAEWRTKHGLGFEVDSFYKRVGYVRTEICSCPPETFASAFDTKGSAWEFPMMMKYRFGPARRVYVVGGYVLRHIGPIKARGTKTIQDFIARTIVTTPIDTSEPSDLHDRNFSGLTVGIGIELGLGHLRLLPEFRYTAWLTNITGVSNNALQLKSNQAEFLLGFLF